MHHGVGDPGSIAVHDDKRDPNVVKRNVQLYRTGECERFLKKIDVCHQRTIEVADYSGSVGARERGELKGTVCSDLTAVFRFPDQDIIRNRGEAECYWVGKLVVGGDNLAGPGDRFAESGWGGWLSFWRRVFG